MSARLFHVPCEEDVKAFVRTLNAPTPIYCVWDTDLNYPSDDTIQELFQAGCVAFASLGSRAEELHDWLDETLVGMELDFEEGKGCPGGVEEKPLPFGWDIDTLFIRPDTNSGSEDDSERSFRALQETAAYPEFLTKESVEKARKMIEDLDSSIREVRDLLPQLQAISEHLERCYPVKDGILKWDSPLADALSLASSIEHPEPGIQVILLMVGKEDFGKTDLLWQKISDLMK